MPLQTIPWSRNVFLKWSNFEAESNPAAYEDSKSTIRYRIMWTVDSEKADEKILFLIRDVMLVTEFYPGLSWVRKMYATADLLKHEQGHFDLAELARADITADISSAVCGKRYPANGKNDEQRKQFARERSSMLLNAELKKCQARMEERRTKYDQDTDFGHDRNAQSEYDALFSKLRGRSPE